MTHSKKKKCLKVVNNILAAEHYSFRCPPPRLGRTRKTLVREKDSRKSQIAPEEEPKRKSSVTGCRGGGQKLLFSLTHRSRTDECCAVFHPTLETLLHTSAGPQSMGGGPPSGCLQPPPSSDGTAGYKGSA